MAGQKKTTIKSLSEDLEMMKEQVKEIKVLKEQVKDIPVLQVRGRDLEKIIEDFRKEANSENLNKETANSNAFKCRKCEVTLNSKKALKNHIKKDHVQMINCKSCDKVFTQNFDLEVHIKNEHIKSEKFKCESCDKTFVLNWRLLKHKQNHLKSDMKKCHYFNNNLTCPFEEMGCMFSHEDAVLCQYDEKCRNILCSYKHSGNIQKTE